MIPSSTKQGASVIAFPDVCRTVSAGGPIPTPYPNIAHGAPGAAKTTTAGSPKVVKAGSSFAASIGDEAGSGRGLVSTKVTGAQSFNMTRMHSSNVTAAYQHAGMSASAAHLLRNKLNHLHHQLTSLPGRNPELWHSLVDEYVQATANLYVTLAESNQV